MFIESNQKGAFRFPALNQLVRLCQLSQSAPLYTSNLRSLTQFVAHAAWVDGRLKNPFDTLSDGCVGLWSLGKT